MRPTDNPNQMIVEGSDDAHCVIGLMCSHVDWPTDQRCWPVFVHVGNGAEQILSDGLLLTYLKQSAVTTFGVVLDGDSKPSGRYGSVRKICLNDFPELPVNLPADGVVVQNAEGKRLGVWIMPDNSGNGTLESFLKCLIPETSVPLWHHAMKCVTDAKRIGAPFADKDGEKASLYTWLAWQDPPDQTLGLALKKNILDPRCPSAGPFIAWFKRLYDLAPRSLLFVEEIPT